MTAVDDFDFTPKELAGQRALNRRLARLPRMSVIGRTRRALVRAVLWAGAIGADRKLRRRGLSVSYIAVRHGGRPLRFRIIHPRGTPRALVLDIHGGAWAFGSPAMDDPSNAAIAERAGALVVALDYPVALPRPVGELQDDAAAAVAWFLSAPGDLPAGLPLAVTGESAGAHLVLGAVIRARDAGLPVSTIRAMLLHCGVYDLGGTPSATNADASALVLDGLTLAAQLELLFPGLSPEALSAPALSPLNAPLHDLPPSLVVVGDIDPLRDDSRFLADRLAAAGGATTLVELPDAPHGIIHLPEAYADRVRAASAAWLARVLAAA